MALTDDELFDFDKQELMGWDSARVERALAEQRDAYRAQLVAARWIDGWRRRLGEPDAPAQKWQSRGLSTGLRRRTRGGRSLPSTSRSCAWRAAA
jgi:hypothetical protein